MVKGIVMLSSLLINVVFPLILHYNAGVVHCFREKKLLDLRQFKTTDSSCLSQKPRNEKGATTLEMKQRGDCDGPGATIEDWNKLFQSRLTLDEVRVGSLQARIKNKGFSKIFDVSAAETQIIPIISGVELMRVMNYIVTLELGGRNMTVMVDTGSDLTWIQCQPCRSCYEQREPIFDPSTSPTYQTLSCNSSDCQSLLNATGNEPTCGDSPPGSCNYVSRYGDGSYSRGVLGRDHLNLGETSVNNFTFGCGQNSKGLFGATAGLMGLGRSSNISLFSQTVEIFGGVFSHCLPVPRSIAPGTLVFGDNSSVYNTSTPFSYTRMLPDRTFYYLNLTGITVNGVALQDPALGRKPVIIDSGTVITRLPPTIYNVLKAEFQKQFSRYPSAPAHDVLDTCFDLRPHQQVDDVPDIKIQFEGNAELNVDAFGVLYHIMHDLSQTCLAFASLSSDDDIGIIGNYQQINQRVIYDTKESKLGFATEDCTVWHSDPN